MPDIALLLFEQITVLLTGGNDRSSDFLLAVIPGLASTLLLIYVLGGRLWAFLYFATIPVLNWSFGVIAPFQLAEPSSLFAHGVFLHPLTLVTGLVFVLRDFVQRLMGKKVLIVMALAIGWSFFYAWPVIALASGVAFAFSEMVDWAMFTFTRYKLSTRILLSSAVAVPIDSTIFLYGADLAQQMALGTEPGTMFNLINWVVFVIGKMVAAFVIAYGIRQREEAGDFA